MSNLESFDYSQLYVSDSKNCALDVFTAASIGDVSYFVDYSDGIHNIKDANKSGWTPIMYACARGHSTLVNYFLRMGASKKSKSNYGVTPLMLAISSGDMCTIESIFDVSSIEEQDFRLWSPLVYAIYFNREKCVEFLLNQGANVNIVDYQNETPLMAAIKSGRETIVELILKSAENLDVVSYKNESALSLANKSHNPKILKLVKEQIEYLSNLNTVLHRPLGKSILKQEVLSPSCQTTISEQSMLKKTPRRRSLFNLKMKKGMSYSVSEAENCITEKYALTPLKENSGNAPLNESKNRCWSPCFNPARYPHADVESFLKCLALEKYWPVFRDEEVDFETLLTLSEENLKEVGIKLFGPRRKIYLAIQQLKKQFYK